MGRRFKDVNVNQLNELMNKLNEKIKASCLKDALLFAQAYAAAEELMDIKIKKRRSCQMTKQKSMNEIIKKIINETLDEVNTLNSPAASFGAGAAIGILTKHLNEYEKYCYDQGFDEGLECAENIIMHESYDFKHKMFPEYDHDYDIDDLIQKYGIREVNKKYLEYKNENEKL